MLDEATRGAIFKLHDQGHGSRAIAQALGVARASVRRVLDSGRATLPESNRAQLAEPWREQILELERRYQGHLGRVHEELIARGAALSYPTLTAFCRRHHIGRAPPRPAGRYEFAAGAEMQHDTSPYTIEIGGKKVKRQCASLVLGYSRRMYIRFYAKFDRFACKVFLTEAFKALGGTCGQCVIDNSHVVIVCGTGKNAQVSPEMEAFEKRFGFKFLAHELGHADRSGKVERDFWYVERNFLVGRTFRDDADLNIQSQAWLDEKADVRHMRELGASPRELFVAERSHLVPLPLPALPAEVVELRGRRVGRGLRVRAGASSNQERRNAQMQQCSNAHSAPVHSCIRAFLHSRIRASLHSCIRAFDWLLHYACGSSTRNVVPAPGVDCTSISPSCICTVRYTIERPIPLPFGLVVKYRSKIRVRSSGLMPTPVSENDTDARPSRIASPWIAAR